MTEDEGAQYSAALTVLVAALANSLREKRSRLVDAHLNELVKHVLPEGRRSIANITPEARRAVEDAFSVNYTGQRWKLPKQARQLAQIGDSNVELVRRIG